LTPHEIALIGALASCSMLPGTSHKRFVRDLAFVAGHSPEKEISLRQRHYLELLAWKYRRQLSRSLAPDSKPLNLPAKRKEARARIGGKIGVEASKTPGIVDVVGARESETQQKDLFS
jgi:hypothetical protein